MLVFGADQGFCWMFAGLWVCSVKPRGLGFLYDVGRLFLVLTFIHKAWLPSFTVSYARLSYTLLKRYPIEVCFDLPQRLYIAE